SPRRGSPRRARAARRSARARAARPRTTARSLDPRAEAAVGDLDLERVSRCDGVPGPDDFLAGPHDRVAPLERGPRRERAPAPTCLLEPGTFAFDGKRRCTAKAVVRVEQLL